MQRSAEVAAQSLCRALVAAVPRDAALAAFVHCRCPCGGREFQVEMDESAGYATLGCVADSQCERAAFVVADVELTERQAWDRGGGRMPGMWFCPCRPFDAARFEVGVGVCTAPGEPGAVKGVYLAGLCVACGRAACLGRWACAGDLADLVERFTRRTRIRFR